jgi:hypothetical protein
MFFSIKKLILNKLLKNAKQINNFSKTSQKKKNKEWL